MMTKMYPQPTQLATSAEPSDLPAYRQRRTEEPPRTAIIGGGPLGLEAALYAARLGHAVLLFEREPEIAPEVRAWAHVTMFTAWAENRSPLGELALRETVTTKKVPLTKLPAGSLHPTGEQFRELYLTPLAALLGASVHVDTRVAALGRSYLFADEHQDQPEKRSARRFRLLTRSPREERIFTADYVVDASGMTRTPRWAGAGGLPALGEMGSFGQIFHQVPDVLGRDRMHFLGKRVLLIGDGTSAATTAAALAELIALDPQTSVLWVTKSRAALPLELVPHDPLVRRDTLLKKANLLIENKQPGFEYSPITQIEALQYSLANSRFQATLQVNHETKRVTVDAVIANVGFRRDVPAYERELHVAEPDFYTLGEKTLPPGDFLLIQGRAQIRDIFRRITNQPALDLYAAAEKSLALRQEPTEA